MKYLDNLFVTTLDANQVITSSSRGSRAHPDTDRMPARSRRVKSQR